MAKHKKNEKIKQIIITTIIIILLALIEYTYRNIFNSGEIQANSTTNNIEANNIETNNIETNNIEANSTIANYNNITEIPEYTGEPYVTINNNIPYFEEKEHTTESFEKYSNLDEQGRCGVAYANICKKTMPPEGDKRGDISRIKPTGWKQAKYDGEYLYNRCHLIGYQLSDEDDNKQNLITGTRYFNVQGMLPFENQVAEYVKNKDGHVLYRVTPIFKADNLLASGVEMEAYSVEDNGKGICFNVYVFNIQPGINIDYKTGESTKIED